MLFLMLHGLQMVDILLLPELIVACRIWDAMNGRGFLNIHAHSSNVTVVAWSPDGTQVASAGTDRTIKIWELRSKNRDIYILRTFQYCFCFKLVA